MSQKIHLQKATRIEGNADIHIEIENGYVKSARFMVQDFRGFEKLIQGKSVEATPHIVSRICGLCCTTHEVASLRAIEDALSVQVPPAVSKLRTIAVLGEWIASHALSYFFLTLPDSFGGSPNIFDLMKEDPIVARDAFFLRRSGNRIVEIVAKRAVHPVALGIARFLVPITPPDLAEIRRIAVEVKETSGRLITLLGQQPVRGKHLPFPVDHRVNFLSYDSRPGQELFRVFNKVGEVTDEFSRETFADHIAEMRVDWSLAKFPYLARSGFPEGILLVGPLSRLFQPGGVLDDPELANFALTDQLRRPDALSLDDLDTCRLLEIFWAARQILTYVDEVDLAQLDHATVDLAQSGKGIGVVEAPRGVLVHNYLVNQGMMERMNLLVATQFNNAYINLVLQDQSERHTEEDHLSEEGKDLIARCVRTFDPCLTCATH
ncbi:MAG TPA: Ni/Fe hydrogenase subunit alpha [Anaerolineaceae bacterium]|nr:Ni/Fe hydrogenase subunit alpha [Anaerolineaceae bacterium]